MQIKIDKTKSDELMEAFKAEIPDFKDFQNPGQELKEEELDYKRALLESFRQKQGEIEADLNAGKIHGVISKLKAVVDQTNLVDWRSWDAFGNPLQEKESLALLRAIRDASEAPYAGPGTLEPVFDVIKKDQIKIGWILLSSLLWLWNPESYFPIKSSYVRKFAQKVDQKLKMVSPGSKPMDEFLELGRETQRMLEPWKPNDWVDVQSFIWVIASRDLPKEKVDEVDDSGELALPFQNYFNSVEEANSLLDLSREGVVALGPNTDSPHDPRLVLTLPQNIRGRTGTLRVNYGNWVAFSIIKQTDGRSFFQIQCPVSLVPEDALHNDEDTLFERESSEDLPLVRVPVATALKPDFLPILRQAMREAAAHFHGWKGSPYRIHHQKELWDLIFNPEKRARILKFGLPSSVSPPPDPVEEDGMPDPDIPERYSKADALAELFITPEKYVRIEQLLHRKKNVILQGPPGVGKSFLAKRLAYSLMGEKDNHRVTMIQFHQSYGYEDFIQGYRPSGGDGASFEKRNGVFYSFCEKAKLNRDQPYYFIIDEINRGNLSRIFGELMLLIEPDKRGRDHALPLTYSPNETFYVPENVHIIGLMNTADRSLAMVDYALRRRFAFVDLKPAFDDPKFVQLLEQMAISTPVANRIIKGIEELNLRIEKDTRDLGPGYCIGHSYFCPMRPVPDEDAWLQEIIETELLPLLEEYWPDDTTGIIAGAIAKLS